MGVLWNYGTIWSLVVSIDRILRCGCGDERLCFGNLMVSSLLFADDGSVGIFETQS